MIPIKGLTLHQPWASLVAAGAKRIETRSWQTSYRGLIAIHSSLKSPDPAIWRDNPAFVDAINKTMGNDVLRLFPGKILAVAELLECRATAGKLTETGPGPKYADWVHGLSHEERIFGDYSPGRYGWIFGPILKLHLGSECRGRQRLWDVDPATARLLIEVWTTRTPVDPHR